MRHPCCSICYYVTYGGNIPYCMAASLWKSTCPVCLEFPLLVICHEHVILEAQTLLASFYNVGIYWIINSQPVSVSLATIYLVVLIPPGTWPLANTGSSIPTWITQRTLAVHSTWGMDTQIKNTEFKEDYWRQRRRQTWRTESRELSDKEMDG